MIALSISIHGLTGLGIDYGGFGMTEKKTKTLSNGKKAALWALSQKEMTSREIAEFLKCSQSCVVGLVGGLKRDGLVFISGSKKQPGSPAPIYAVFVKHPKPKWTKLKSGQNPTVRDAIEAAIHEMGPMTAVELASYIGTPRYAINGTLTHYRKGGQSSKVFRVAKWVWLDRRGWIPAYGLGPIGDATKPLPNKKENRCRHREKMKSLERCKTKTFAGNPFGELIHMAGATYEAAYWNRVTA